MFYAHFVLAKKGPLARIWLAAHWDKKLTKAHVFETNIQKSVEDILHPKVKIALRTSGHLLLGVVRIYSRKAKYLLADCNEAFVKIKMAFRPGMVDLPEENREAAVQAITLPEVFHDFDANVPDLNDAEMQAQFTLNQSRAEEITMREDYGCQLPPLNHDEEGFGDLGFGDSGPLEMIRDGSSIDHSLEPGSFFAEVRDRSESRRNRPSSSVRLRSETDTPIRDDGFGGNLGNDEIGGGLFEGGGLFDDAPIGDVPSLNEPSDLDIKVGTKNRENLDNFNGTHIDSDDDGIDAYGGPPSVGGSSSSSRPVSPFGGPTSAGMNHPPASPRSPARVSDEVNNLDQGSVNIPDGDDQLPGANVDQTTLLHNEEEGFALAPVDTTTVKGWARHKRKRKLIVDEVKNISGEEMKSQLSDTSDIVTTLDLAPPTRRLMHWKETGGVEKLFALPGRSIPARSLFRDYQRHLTSQPTENDDFGLTPEVEKENLPLETVRVADAGESIRQDFPEAPTPQPVKRTVGRKRKAPVDLEAEAEEHQKRREVQYQSLLAPSTQSSPVAPPATIQSSLIDDHSFPQFPLPSLPDVQEPPETNTSTLPEPVVQHAQSFVDATREFSEMENMGYDQNMGNLGLDAAEPFTNLPPQTPGALSERAPPTPWHDDYEMAPSVGPLDEQLADETYEQFEERVLNKRAATMYNLVRAKMQLSDSIPFSDMAFRNNKKQVAQKFYTLLVLKKNQVLELAQAKSYAEILVSQGPKFESPSL
ncbi:putative RAD21 [Daphnia pulex]|uniref:Putative RAD21 n=1 Tax=Daphnia pulex TaxID=6669 RepID=E9HJL7_DAPPU|nr:double-strand-break repair protein rad21 homolog [Daphnia pulicaria]XP_046653426.1 double-strand-break repair protein rad21 homolog [Daphnia pulicaria]XP_046653427.1 double-strand-break repair protein rad21 homolog [Daphnia pulicaria]XP_046653428.1 double-strand-break repair protein rad21 homolog [Daphnia pulicaria]EFX68066.1 putative RAD21 [Daphnia pulex]|eukprot:EFX68066.1 putative RAD21 [Daphnia pulex]